MRANHVRIHIDHLWLNPQSELHPVGAHPVDQCPETAGPHVIVHVPIAQARAVVATIAEPAIVQDKSLNPDSARVGGQVEKIVQLVIKVDGFPGIEYDGSRRARVSRPRADVRMECASDAINPVGGECRVGVWGGVLLTTGELHFAGSKELGVADAGGTNLCALDERRVVTAEAEVGRPHSTAAVVEPGRADGGQDG